MAAFEKGIGGRKSRAMMGVYDLDEHWVGRMTETGTADSRGTERGLLTLLEVFIPGAVGPDKEASCTALVIP